MSAEVLAAPRLAGLSAEALEHLAAFKREVEAALPGQVARVTLFGSRARGDAEEDSDYDVAVFVRDGADDWRLAGRVSEIAYPHMLDGVYISPIVLPEDYLDDPENLSALGEDIINQGIALV